MISVIIPVYRVEAYLPQCLDSVLGQTYEDLEVLCVDDGSPDGSGAILDAYAARDARVRVFHTENRGVSEARNLALETAAGAYLAFVDSDDWLEPEMLETLQETILKEDADAAICGQIEEYPDRSVPLKEPAAIYRDGEALEALLKRRISTVLTNKLWRKELFEGIRFPAGRAFEDVEAGAGLLARCRKVASVETCLYHYRMREGSVYHSHSARNLAECWMAYRNRYEDLREALAGTELERELLIGCALAISRTWHWYGADSRKEQERYRAYTEEMSRFSREHFPVFGEKGWSKQLRLSIFLSRLPGRLSLPVGNALNRIYRKLHRKDLY